MSTSSPDPNSDGLTDYDQLRQHPSLFVEHVCGVEPFDYQKEFLDTDTRHRVIASGRQVGKSRMCAWLALHRAITEAHTQVLITAPSLRQSSLLFDTLYSEISQSGLTDDEWGIDRDTQTILEFDNGSAIHCIPTGRDGNNIRGYTAEFIIVDEAAFVDDVIFEDILEPMTFATQGEFVLASTPYGKSGYFYDQFDSAEYDDEWSNVQVSSYQNPLIKESDLEKFKRGKTETQIKREVLGVFDESGDSFFPVDAIKACTANGPINQEHTDCWLGVDIAGSGQDRTVFYGVDAGGNVFLDDEVYEDMGVLEAASRASTLDDMYDFTGIYVDRTAIGEGAVEALAQNRRLSRKLTEVYFTLQKKQQLYQRLKAALESESLLIPNTRDLRDELEAITPSKTQNDNLKLQPSGDAHDDHVDSLALACWGLPEFGEQRGHSGPKTAVTGTTQQNNARGKATEAINRQRRQQQRKRHSSSQSKSRSYVHPRKRNY